MKNQTLINANDIEAENLGGGVSRKIMTFCDEMMLTKNTFEKGAIGTIHNHIHLQMGYVAKGVFEVTVGNDTKILKQGDVFYAPSMVFHGVKCLEEGELVDVFNPKRADFL
jgi:quercetin dioxygenase-like cupin family protein